MTNGFVPDLAAPLADLENVPTECIPAMLGDLEKAKAVLWARLTAPTPSSHGPGDHLLSIDDAGDRLGVTHDWLRRRPELPFIVKLSDGVVRYSSQGIERYIAARVGRAG